MNGNLETGAGIISIKEDFVLTAGVPATDNVKNSCFELASSAPMGVKSVICLEVQMRKLCKKTDFLQVSNLVTNVFLGPVFLGKHINGISSKANAITPMSLSHNANLRATCRNPALTCTKHVEEQTNQ